MNDLFSLAGQTAVISGSSSGIGLATAKLFVEHGARGVTISSRRDEVCREIADSINQEAGREVALPIAADLTDAASMEALVDKALAVWGQIDTIIAHAAAGQSSGSVLDIDPDTFEDLLVANIKNNVVFVRRAVPSMKDRGNGNIIFTSSVAGTGAYPFVGVYSIVKRAILQLVENLAAELGPFGIRANAISPGYTRPGGSDPSTYEDIPALVAKVTEFPLGRIGEPVDQAACAVYLASQAGAFVTGRNHVVDGGYTLRRPAPSDTMMYTVAP